MSKAEDDKIDQLYRLPLGEFTAARNALAKEGGPRAAEIKKLEKPILAAWAVNQLYWQRRKTYDTMIDTAERLREEFRKQLAGKTAKVEEAEKKQREAMVEARAAARELMEEAGSSPTEAVLQSVAETLDALPGDEAPGRLTRPLRRVGFGALDGLPIVVAPKKEKPKAADDTATARKKDDDRETRMARERLRFAESAEREAQATLERHQRALERAEGVQARLEQELAETNETLRDLKKKVSEAEGELKKTKVEKEKLLRALRV